ncbi:LD-carboxypeptidase [Longimicrobium sp.]|uniref:S66 peptidase family protein n=1 Tax=Longimicrobium sp. TaxID=2029185 RepID=UPI002E32285B|nr:LD-carboxypeptidase [Longimicrobium sp.]HEX6041677.1 LD-carboxypeptidase [Longimicrobium sp.]
MIVPPKLEAGARVALVAAAGPIPEGGVERAMERVRSVGWEPVAGQNCRGRRGYLAGSDAERAADLNAALRDPQIRAVWFLRGGYGTMRILDDIDWPALARDPKPLIGFSDNTAVHLGANAVGVVGFHGPHPHTPEFPDFARDGLLRVLASAEPAGVLPFPPGGAERGETLAGGSAEGPLVGGNLSLLSATMGTPYAVQPEGAILFIEEVGESPYRLDRMLSHLTLAGVLDAVSGIAVGGITEVPGENGDALAREVLHDRLGRLGVPVAIGFPFGHIDDNWTLPVGLRARLDADAGTLALLEGAVA